MKLKETAFSKNVNTNNSSTPDFSQELGQGKNHYMTNDGFPEVLNLLLYYQINKDKYEDIECALGKGNQERQPLPEMAQKVSHQVELASVVNKIMVNGEPVLGAKLIMFIVKEDNPTSKDGSANPHLGRRKLKFPQNATYQGEALNSKCMSLISGKLDCSEEGSWVVTHMDVVEDALNLSVVVVDYDQPHTFNSADERRAFLESHSVESRFEKDIIHPESMILNECEDRPYTKEELVRLCKNIKDSGVPYATHIFGFKYGAICEKNNISLAEVTKSAGCSQSTSNAEPQKGAGIAKAIQAGLFGMSFYKPGVFVSSVNNANMMSRGLTNTDDARQLIYYGAPGTGKSYTINLVTEKCPKENVFRITFHPDSDYSTFVGSYKPTMGKQEPIYGFDSVGNTIKVEDPIGTTVFQRKITYRFVPQAFLKAYVRAYQTEEPVYLVIEEINRGNCAQIFGDIFQLLDREENGVSCYSVKPDSELENYLKENLGAKYDEDEGMRLPSNLYIYATMNTSDQSLFPIDSAFKRRWDWEYVPIRYNNTDWKIVLGNMMYSWVEFQEKVNDLIFAATDSEDKQMGDFFVKADKDSVISEDVLFNKIVFYLWNDVSKDGEGEIFKVKRDNERDAQDITFSKFMKGERTKNLQDWMAYLEVKGEEYEGTDSEHPSDEEEDPETPTNELGKSQLNYWTKFKKYMLSQGLEDNLKVVSRNYRDYKIGTTGVFVSDTIHCGKGRIRSQIYITLPLAKSLGPWLMARKDEIEQQLGYNLNWDTTAKGTAVFRYQEEGFDFNNDESVDKAIKIMAEKTKSLKEVFPAYIEQYKAEQK